MNPLNGVITSSFGSRTNPVLGTPELHTGTDIAAATGTAVLAVKDGVITETGKSATYGYFLKYDTDDGYSIMYAHLSKIKVKNGDAVKQGETVALSGNTGRSTGPHLHYGVWKNGVMVDPMAFLSLNYTDEVEAEYLARGEGIR